jgi:tRNA modification GTPase
MPDDTIAAIATPLGEGGLAVLRLSGPEALAVADRSFVPVGKSSLQPSAAPTHTIHYGRIERAGRVVDEVLVAVMHAPRTFTREDVVEITCHGGLMPARLVLDALLGNGARLALPGEFTRRAFLNGRFDLAQAEAVADLIHSRTELALAAAHEQLAGKLSLRINRLRDDMVKTLAHVEAHIDFPTKTFPRPLSINSGNGSNAAWRSWMNCCAPPAMAKSCDAASAPPSWPSQRGQVESAESIARPRSRHRLAHRRHHPRHH